MCVCVCVCAVLCRVVLCVCVWFNMITKIFESVNLKNENDIEQNQGQSYAMTSKFTSIHHNTIALVLDMKL